MRQDWKLAQKRKRPEPQILRFSGLFVGGPRGIRTLRFRIESPASLTNLTMGSYMVAPADYGNRDLDKCIYTNYWTFDYLFAVCDNDKTIILPYLEITEEGVKTVPFVFDHPLMLSTERS